VFDTTVKGLEKDGHVGFVVLPDGAKHFAAPTWDGGRKDGSNQAAARIEEPFEIKDLKLDVVSDGKAAFEELQKLVSADVKQAMRPAYDLSGVWVAERGGNQDADVIYDVRCVDDTFTASYGDLGKKLSSRLEGTIVGAAIEGRFRASREEGKFWWKTKSNTEAEMSWESTQWRRGELGLHRVGEYGGDKGAWRPAGTWVGEERPVRYRVSESSDGMVRAEVIGGGKEAVSRMEGVVLGKKWFARAFTPSNGTGRCEWEMQDANTAIVRWVLYTEDRDNTLYGEWTAEYVVKRSR
jgi:hypothetical protein